MTVEHYAASMVFRAQQKSTHTATMTHAAPIHRRLGSLTQLTNALRSDQTCPLAWLSRHPDAYPTARLSPNMTIVPPPFDWEQPKPPGGRPALPGVGGVGSKHRPPLGANDGAAHQQQQPKGQNNKEEEEDDDDKKVEEELNKLHEHLKDDPKMKEHMEELRKRMKQRNQRIKQLREQQQNHGGGNVELLGLQQVDEQEKKEDEDAPPPPKVILDANLREMQRRREQEHLKRQEEQRLRHKKDAEKKAASAADRGKFHPVQDSPGIEEQLKELIHNKHGGQLAGANMMHLGVDRAAGHNLQMPNELLQNAAKAAAAGAADSSGDGDDDDENGDEDDTEEGDEDEKEGKD